MSETDAKDGCPAVLQNLFQVLDSGSKGGRVAGTVGDEQPVVIVSEKGREVMIPGNNKDFHSTVE
jgi:hypothetical protein